MKAEVKTNDQNFTLPESIFCPALAARTKRDRSFCISRSRWGRGVVLRDLLKNPEVEYATVVCGDNYFHENEEAVLDFLDGSDDTSSRRTCSLPVRLFTPGAMELHAPKAASFVRERWNIPAVTGLYGENPGTRKWAATSW